MTQGTTKEVTLERGVRGIRLENDLIAATILPDKGADIYKLIYQPKSTDVLWKSPWGLRRPAGGHPTASNSAAAWIEAYEGGWQVLFPSGGGPCDYKGVELNFHGEASVSAWDVVDQREGTVTLRLRLARSPLQIERTLSLDPNGAILVLKERIRNDGGEPIDYMWGHHPAYGAPFISEACVIDTNARTLIADDEYNPPANPLTLGALSDWPHAERDGVATDLSKVPSQSTPRALLGYFDDFSDDHAWYGITNQELGFGVGLVWQRDDFPHAWFWQEMHASPGFPWYKGVYVMAIEPNTSHPGQGLITVMDKTGTHRTLDPGQEVSVEIRACFYQSSNGITGIDPSGQVRIRE
jgi:galactose mutarotase-like enzyme